MSSGVPLMDFSVLGQIGENLRAGQKERSRLEALSTVPPGDYQAATQKLMSVGDMEGASILARLAEAKASHDWTRTYQGGQLDIERQKLDLLKQRAAGGGEPKFGMNGQIFQAPDGTFHAVQFGGNGEIRTQPIGNNMSPAKGVSNVDTGTGTMLIDKATGATVREVPKDIYGRESAEAIGQIQGKQTAEALGAIRDADQALWVIEQIRNHPGRDYATGIGGVIPPIPNTSQRDFIRLVDQAKAQAFLQAFNSLKGGGAITNIEGEKATDAFARLDRAQTRQGFEQALNDIESVIRTGRAVAERRAQGLTPFNQTRIDPRTGQPMAPPPAAKDQGRVGAPPNGAGQPPSIAEGATATNPQTGQRIIFRNGQWEQIR